jgi:hypothetical protein
MRIYVYGGDRERCIGVANVLNEKGGRAIIGGPVGFEELAHKLGKEIDCAIFVSNDPDVDAIEANRERKIRAVACYNQKGVGEAMKAKANLFVLDGRSGDLPNIAALLAGAIEVGDAYAGRKPAGHVHDHATGAAAREGAGGNPSWKAGLGFLGGKKSVKQKAEEEREEEAEEGVEGDSKPEEGLKGRIKYIFGVD